MQAQESLIKEIFMMPSTEIRTDRFNAESVEAVCSGKCSGKCSSIFEAQNNNPEA